MLGSKEEWIELGAHPDRPWELAWLSEDDQRLWHDGALAGVLAGYMPPWRPKTVRTLKAPQFYRSLCTVGGWERLRTNPSCLAPSLQACNPSPTHRCRRLQFKDCKRAGCTGNGSFWDGVPSPTTPLGFR